MSLISSFSEVFRQYTLKELDFEQQIRPRMVRFYRFKIICPKLSLNKLLRKSIWFLRLTPFDITLPRE